MLKRFFCLILVLSIVLCSSLTAFAVSPEGILVDLIIEGTTFVCGLINDKVDEVKNMNGEEFYNWYNEKQIDSAAWRAYLASQYAAYQNSSKPNVTVPLVSPATLVDESDTTIGMMFNHKYTASLMNREIVEQLNDAAIEIYSANRRAGSLEDFNLYTEEGSVIDITVTGTPSTYLGTSNAGYLGYEGFYDFSGMTSVNNCIHYFTGSCNTGNAPPMFYIPKDCVMYQGSVALPDQHFYIIIGYDRLLQINTFGAGHVLLCPAYYNTSNDLETYYFECISGDYINYDDLNWNAWGKQHPYPLHRGQINGFSVYSSGENIANIPIQAASNNETVDTWSYISLYNKMFGYELDIDEYIPPETFLPSDIPYDSGGNVVVLVPEGGGDIVYMAPDEYTEYVNNGTIVQGDQNNDYSETTINNITNDYNNYINSQNDSKLDEIIEWLKKIYNKIGGSDGGVNINFPDFNFPKLFEFPDVEPCYENFSDCLGNNTLYNVVIAASEDASNQIEQGDVTVARSSVLGPALGRVPAEGDSDTDVDYNDLYRVDISWYAAYRDDVHEVLKLVAYALGLYSLWKSFKSVFGITVDAGDVNKVVI